MIIGIVGVAIALALTLFVLMQLPIFAISSIDASSTEHIDADSIAKLANIESGTTLLNVDISQVVNNVKKNPWVASVSVTREFPDKLKVSVSERKISALVLMSSGNVAWYLGDDGVWIEPVNIGTEGTTTAEDVALTKANELGCLLITNVPASVNPSAASKTSDTSILAVLDYQKGFSSDFSSQIVSYTAPSTDSITCTLSNGVEVSLGAATDIDTKEKVITQILETYPDQITYINVRVPSNPSYRKLSSDQVKTGTGARVTDTATEAATNAATDAATNAPTDTTTNTASKGTSKSTQDSDGDGSTKSKQTSKSSETTSDSRTGTNN